ncbi:MAG: bacterial proteasome activator family protein [Ilumatobacteraceae bacterium]
MTTAAPTGDGDRAGGSVEHGELIGVVDSDSTQGAVTEPAKVMRIGSMVKQLLEEVRAAPLDDASRERLAEVYERSVTELADALSPDLQDELRMLALPFDDESIPTDAELRIAQAQLVGWLEGLFHGIQATLFAQQLAARHQLEQMRQLPNGGVDPGAGVGPRLERPGTYL